MKKAGDSAIKLFTCLGDSESPSTPTKASGYCFPGGRYAEQRMQNRCVRGDEAGLGLGRWGCEVHRNRQLRRNLLRSEIPLSTR